MSGLTPSDLARIGRALDIAIDHHLDQAGISMTSANRGHHVREADALREVERKCAEMLAARSGG